MLRLAMEGERDPVRLHDGALKGLRKRHLDCAHPPIAKILSASNKASSP